MICQNLNIWRRSITAARQCLECLAPCCLAPLLYHPLLLFPPPPPHPPIPRPILCMSPTPQARALSDRPLPPVQARCHDWPRASFSVAHRTQWPRRRLRPPAFHITPPISHAHTCKHVNASSSRVCTGLAAHVHDTCTIHMYLCLNVFI